MKHLSAEDNFLAIEEKDHSSYKKSKYVIQQVPYEYTSSYVKGSAKGPRAIVKASQYVELYDEELGQETYLQGGICTLKPLNFSGLKNRKAIELIEFNTDILLEDGKYVISLGAEHTVTLGFVKSFQKKYENLTVLQLDAHSDLRTSYHNNIYSHASVMARVNELGVNICQVGIRAQCAEEAALIKSTDTINTFYAHDIRRNSNWIDQVVSKLTENVYITIDADGFDPSIMPAVGTPEPNGLLWNETVELLKRVINEKNVVGFDVVEIAPVKGSIISEYTLAKLIYKMIGYLSAKPAKTIRVDKVAEVAITNN
jgi:agmatinase